MIAVPVTLITTGLGMLSALLLTREFRFKLLFAVQLCLPFFIPRIVFAIAQVTFLATARAAQSLVTIWIAQSW